MAKKTEAQVIKFLDSQVGKSVNEECGDLQGQCASLGKALYDYLGIPNPYKGRGNAKDVGNTLLAENIAEKGYGKVNICINPYMGRIGNRVYGHLWVKIKGKSNYEQNGAKALRVTKNTRPLKQAVQIVNLDKWLAKNSPKPKPKPKPKKKPAKKYHKVKKGDTLSGIAAKNKISLGKLLGFPENKKYRKNPNEIDINDKVRVK